MHTATARVLRRHAIRPKPPTLRQVLDQMEKDNVPSKLTGRASAGHILVHSIRINTTLLKQVVRTFAHPTKRTTKGRVAVLKSSI